MGRTLKEKEKMTAAICAFIKSTGDKIELMCMPLGRIFAECEDKTLKNSGFMKALTENGAEFALSDYSDKFIPGADGVLRDFFSSLGEGDKQAEVELCRNAYRELWEKLCIFRDNLPGKMRLYGVLPLMLSLCAVILLI